MSILMTVFLVLGAAATILFVAGYVRGVREAIATHADPELEVDDIESGELELDTKPVDEVLRLIKERMGQPASP